MQNLNEYPAIPNGTGSYATRHLCIGVFLALNILRRAYNPRPRVCPSWALMHFFLEQSPGLLESPVQPCFVAVYPLNFDTKQRILQAQIAQRAHRKPTESFRRAYGEPTESPRGTCARSTVRSCVCYACVLCGALIEPSRGPLPGPNAQILVRSPLRAPSRAQTRKSWCKALSEPSARPQCANSGAKPSWSPQLTPALRLHFL